MSATKIQRHRAPRVVLLELELRAAADAAPDHRRRDTSRRPRCRGADALARAARGRLLARLRCSLGYLRNRPLAEEWERLGLRTICSETWFADRPAEQESFGSDYYRESVMQDEAALPRPLVRLDGAIPRRAGEPDRQGQVPRSRVWSRRDSRRRGRGARGRSPALGRRGPTVSSAWLDDRAACARARAGNAVVRVRGRACRRRGAARVTIEPIVIPTPFPVGPVNCGSSRAIRSRSSTPGRTRSKRSSELQSGSLHATSGSRTSSCSSSRTSTPTTSGSPPRSRPAPAAASPGHELLAGYVGRCRGGADRRGRVGGAPAALAGDATRAVPGVPRDRPRAPSLRWRRSTARVRLAEGDVIEAGGSACAWHSGRGTARPTRSSSTTRPERRLAGDHLIAHISSNPLVHRPTERLL